MNSGLAKRRRPRHRPRPAAFATIVIVLLILLLLPIGYLFVGAWLINANHDDNATIEREGMAYARPTVDLLVALVNAESAAARGAVVDADVVHAAVDNVNKADSEFGERLRVHQRWSSLPAQIDVALGQRGTGENALHAYSAPIALTQALLARLRNTSRLVRDTTTDTANLADAGLQWVPEAMVSAGQIVAQSRPVSAAPAEEIAIARDRMAKAADAVSEGLRASAEASGGEGVNIDLLKPLETFTAAVDEMAQASNVANPAAPSARGAIDTAQSNVQSASQALETSILAAFTKHLDDRISAASTKRVMILASGALALLAVVALVWWCLPAPASALATAPHPASGARPAFAPGPDSTGDLVSAHELVAPTGPPISHNRMGGR